MFKVGGHRTRIDEAALRREVGSHARRAVNRASITAMSRAKKFVPIDTGNLRNSITRTDPSESSRLIWSSVVYTPVHYAPHQEWGTRGSTARPGGVLAFKPKGSSVTIFRKSTGPVPATRFMGKTMDTISVYDYQT